MSSGRAAQRPSIQRWYKVDEASCAHALKLLLKKKAGVPIAGDDAMKGSKHDRANRMLQHG